ncbi:unnamed protein product [Penicillium nalgiovense]|nr:unnamed protein product [Penicillium nalgiovense]CAG8124552.1 unnamed protein product [Penicillium nalgiovense]CAG8153306.1 unnamed protein product [Penicillium nalgiovense]
MSPTFNALTSSLPFHTNLRRFLWVYFQLEILWATCFTDTEIKSALKELPKDLEEIYHCCVKRINFQDRRTLKVLKWISFAARPLHIEELREAIAFDLQDTTWDAERKPQKTFVIGCCANLVIIDPIDNCVRFAHFSVKQYLDKGENRPIPGYPGNKVQGELECGEFCVAYLSFSNFGLLQGKRSNEMATSKAPPAFWVRNRSRKQVSLRFGTIRTVKTPDTTEFKFLHYATTNWALQTRHIDSKSSVWAKFEKLATCFNETWNFHPWKPGGLSLDSHIHGLFGWAVKEKHLPLLSIGRKSEQGFGKICDLPLIDEYLPALHFVAKFGHVNIVSFLLEICDINQQDGDGYTALHHAAMKGNIEVAKSLISKNGVNVNVASKLQFTPLSQAAMNGHYAVTKLLLGNRAVLLESQDSEGRTPLSWAAAKGHEEVVKLLLHRRAKLESKDFAGRTPLIWAIANMCQPVAELLLKKGAATESKDNHGQAPLSWAARTGNETLVKMLLDKGANLESKDIEGRTPLLWATANRDEAMMKLLLDKGSNIESKDTSDRTPLSWAVEDRNEALVKMLLDKGADPESKDGDGQTPLSWATENEHEAVVKLLLDKGSSIHSKDSYGRTPLSWAAENGNETLLNMILDKGLGIGSDSHGRTLLSWAAEHGNQTLVKMLLDKGADTESTDKNSRTPLFWAAENGHEAVVKLLLEKGANAESRDVYGQTPLSWAKVKDNNEVEKLLCNKGAKTKSKHTLKRTNANTPRPRERSIPRYNLDR